AAAHRLLSVFFFQAEDGIRYLIVTGVQTCALPISTTLSPDRARRWAKAWSSRPWRPSRSGRPPRARVRLRGASAAGTGPRRTVQIGRASCRERVEGGGGVGVGKRKTKAADKSGVSD